MNVKFPLVIGSFLLTAACWGVYGPLLHIGQESFSSGEGNRLRAFLCVGLAYFIIAVVIPLMMMSTGGQKSKWSMKGLAWSLIAGAAGAVGALGIILAFNFGGKPVYVMPLVFGLAPVINSFWTIYWQNTWKDINAFFAAGLILVAVGAATVLFFAPTKAAPKPVAVASAGSERPSDGETKAEGAKMEGAKTEAANTDNATADGDKSNADNPATAADAPPKTDGESAQPAAADAVAAAADKPSDPKGGTGGTRASDAAAISPTAAGSLASMFLKVVPCVALTACCWGVYGPLLHWGQMGLGGNRLQAFLCVGLAYFGIAVVVPVILLGGGVSTGWSTTGVMWSLGGGAAGAFGALGIIFAFNFGGKPVYVMPLVFGCAPVVNAFVTNYKAGTWGDVSAFFAAGLILAAVGAMTVLFFAPVQHKPAGGEKHGGGDKTASAKPADDKAASGASSPAAVGESSASTSGAASGTTGDSTQKSLAEAAK